MIKCCSFHLTYNAFVTIHQVGIFCVQLLRYGIARGRGRESGLLKPEWTHVSQHKLPTIDEVSHDQSAGEAGGG